MATLLTAQDVAERLNVSPEWVWAQARAGRIPHIRLGRYRRFREEALEAWISNLERSSVADGKPMTVMPRARPKEQG
jgi:excisionase family DNA binding protein